MTALSVTRCPVLDPTGRAMHAECGCRKIQINPHCTVTIGAKHSGLRLRICLDDIPSRMPIWIMSTDREHGDLGTYGCQPTRLKRASRSMMGNLQNRHMPKVVTAQHRRQSLPFQIGGE